MSQTETGTGFGCELDPAVSLLWLGRMDILFVPQIFRVKDLRTQ